MAQGDDELTRALTALAHDLTVLRIEHGNPALRVIERQAPPSRPLSASAVSEVLNGKRLPGLDFLIALVQTLIAHDDGGRPLTRQDPRLDEWRSRWRELQLLQTTSKRTPGSPPAQEGEPEQLERPEEPEHQVDGTGAATDAPDLRIFVAMPGSTMGAAAAWSSIPEIRRRFLEPVAERIGEQMGCRAELVIEKEKTATGAIHRSMFSEAAEADVYIADLSGANANVYLELGARWALRDGVTIPICQSVGDVRFNASSSRVIPYGPMPDELEESIRQITEAAVDGLRNPWRVDSPVRDGAAYILVSRAEHELLREEIRRLREQQGEDLIRAALKSPSPARRIELLQEAVSRNPAGWRGYFELGVALRKEGRYEEAEGALKVSVRLKEDFAPAWREIGLTLSKRGTSDESAVEAFGRAVTLDDQDAETWATLGGLHRRLARKSSRQGAFDRAMLEQSLACYQKASRLSGNSTYPLMNVARLELLLAGLRRTDTTLAVERFRQLEHLARFAVQDTGSTDAWALFDLADTLLLTGRGAEGLAELRRGVALVPPEEREGVVTSVTEPLRDLLSLDGLLQADAADAVRAAIEEFSLTLEQ
ncbi:tetratricopeptide repeat protein [Streptomyces sp. NPDC029004]|uniref:tetratricopeptide repeat protein n=1 Tax=Streptomyces sp. NPDC029004 TaxID=3154490 RepID=UPI0033D3470E